MVDLTGQIGLRQHASDFIGRGIEWATDSQSHHVVVHIGGGYCVSAERPRVIVRHVTDYPNLVNSSFDLTDDQRNHIANAAIKMLGRPYNTAVLVILGLHKITGWPVPKVVRDWLNRRPNVDCSDLANRALEAGGIHLFAEDSALVTPADFQHVIEQQAAMSKGT
jgi:hypothetical protein